MTEARIIRAARTSSTSSACRSTRSEQLWLARAAKGSARSGSTAAFLQHVEHAHLLQRGASRNRYELVRGSSEQPAKAASILAELREQPQVGRRFAGRGVAHQLRSVIEQLCPA